MNTKDKPIKKANPNPVKEAIGHPNGPSLEEMLNGKEEKTSKNKKKPESGEPDGGPIPVI
ncbi:MAG TPA: hypothetical protein VGM63_09770 [Mucilaginibacter sp.]